MTGEAEIREAAERIAAAGDSRPRAARDPVNLPIIRNWLEALTPAAPDPTAQDLTIPDSTALEPTVPDSTAADLTDPDPTDPQPPAGLTAPRP